MNRQEVSYISLHHLSAESVERDGGQALRDGVLVLKAGKWPVELTLFFDSAADFDGWVRRLIEERSRMVRGELEAIGCEEDEKRQETSE